MQVSSREYSIPSAVERPRQPTLCGGLFPPRRRVVVQSASALLLCLILAGCGSGERKQRRANTIDEATRCLTSSGGNVERIDVPTEDDRDAPETELMIRLRGGSALVGYFDGPNKAKAVERDTLRRDASHVRVLGRYGSILLLGISPLTSEAKEILGHCVGAAGT